MQINLKKMGIAALAISMSFLSCENEEFQVSEQGNNKSPLANVETSSGLTDDLVLYRIPLSVDPDFIFGNQDILLDVVSLSEGVPPKPNSDLQGSVDDEIQTFQIPSQGVSIEGLPENYAGTYIQLKNESGAVLPGFYDFARSAQFRSEDEIFPCLKFFDIFHISLFNVAPGKYTFLFSIYDDQGNVGIPVESKIVVNPWGGDQSLVGNWNFERELIIDFFDGEKDRETILYGIKKCTAVTEIECFDEDEEEDEENIDSDFEEGDILDISSLGLENCSFQSIGLDINTDGSYQGVFKVSLKQVEANSCSLEDVAEFTFEQDSKTVGKWGVYEKNGQTFFINYSFINVINDIDGVTRDDISDGVLETIGDLNEVSSEFDNTTYTVSGNRLRLSKRETDECTGSVQRVAITNAKKM